MSENNHSTVEAFLKEELSRIQALFGEYAGVTVSVHRHLYDSGPAEFLVNWQAYINGSGHLPTGTPDHTFEEMAMALAALKKERTPEVQAQRLREQAAELLKRAGELEASK